MQRFNFTKHNLGKLPSVNTGKRLYVYDEKINGLCLSVTDKGTKSFLVYRKIKGKPIRATLGHFPDMTIEQARKKALETLSKIAGGINPIAEKREHIVTSITLNEIFESYLKIRKGLKKGTILDYRKTIYQTFPDWLNKPMRSITKDMVMQRHAKRGKESQARANNAFRVLRALFNFARVHYEDKNGQTLFPENPVNILSATKGWFRIQRKQTYIKSVDLPKWFKTVIELENNYPSSKALIVRDYLLFLLFTGVRREECASLKWNDVDLNEHTFTLQDPKNRVNITLPMSKFVYELLKNRKKITTSEFVFNGDGKTGHLVEPRKQILRVRKQSGVFFSSHCLRRTFATVGESLDISRYSIKRLLNHKINDDADVTAGYIVPNLDRLREATQKITDQILHLANYPISNAKKIIYAKTKTKEIQN